MGANDDKNGISFGYVFEDLGPVIAADREVVDILPDAIRAEAKDEMVFQSTGPTSGIGAAVGEEDAGHGYFEVYCVCCS
jgi:hypothetical protein